MIQAATTKHIEPKAKVKALDKEAGEAKASNAESKVEGKEFANELMASLGEDADPKVKPVSVSADQIMEAPSSLIKMPEAGPDAVSPKVFDPALTQGVDAIVGPKTTEAPIQLTDEQVIQLAQGKPLVKADVPVMQAQEVNPELALIKNANGEVVLPAVAAAELDAEVSQAMLKTPQVQESGRSPALDMNKAEIDPQLMSMEDFVAQKNIANKKSINNASAYGMPNKANTGKVAGVENGLKSTQTINELGAQGSESSLNSSMNSQQFILNSQADLGANAQVNETHAPVKVFNMSHVKTDSPNQIMTQITDYIVQAKAAKEPTVNMRVNHEELGMIDIRVQKSGVGQESIAVNIGTHSADGKNFFQANSKDLFSHLTSSGLNVTDLKVETPTQTAKSDLDFGGQQSRGQAGADKQFGSQEGQRKHDSDKRQELWNLLSNKEAA